jgi:LAO/AO transport system kinase
VDIARTAHTTVVVEVPGLGDDIQAIKAGILEIADVFAVNKADLQGADHAVMALRMMLDMGSAETRTVMHHGRLMEVVTATHRTEPGSDEAETWKPPIHTTVAHKREGIAELASAILSHRAFLERTGGLGWRERERAAAELEMIIQQETLRNVLEEIQEDDLAALIDQIAGRKVDPYTVGQKLLFGSRSRQQQSFG